MSEAKLNSNALLSAEATLAALAEKMADEYQQDGKNWPRDWMQSHANQRAALIKVCALLVDRAEADNAKGHGSLPGAHPGNTQDHE